MSTSSSPRGRSGRSTRSTSGAWSWGKCWPSASSRSWRAPTHPISLTTRVAAFNGGMFVQPDLSITEQHVLPADVAARTVPILEAHGLDVWLYRGAEWFVRERHAPHVDREEWTVKFPPTVVASF